MKKVLKKVLLLGVILLIAGCASGAAISGEVVTEYDDMTGMKKTQVYLKKHKFDVTDIASPTGGSTELFILRLAEHKGTKSYYICFDLHADSWWFIDTLLIKVGNADPIYLKAVSKDRDAYGRGVSEWVVFEASLEMFQIAAVTPNIRWRVIGSKNSADYEITPEDQIRIKRLLAVI